MAQSRGRKTSSGRKSNTGSRKKKNNVQKYENTVIDEVLFLLSLAITVLLFLCNFHIIGTLGNIVSSFMFGLFGYYIKGNLRLVLSIIQRFSGSSENADDLFRRLLLDRQSRQYGSDDQADFRFCAVLYALCMLYHDRRNCQYRKQHTGFLSLFR